MKSCTSFANLCFSGSLVPFRSWNRWAATIPSTAFRTRCQFSSLYRRFEVDLQVFLALNADLTLGSRSTFLVEAPSLSHGWFNSSSEVGRLDGSIVRQDLTNCLAVSDTPTQYSSCLSADPSVARGYNLRARICNHRYRWPAFPHTVSRGRRGCSHKVGNRK